MSDKAPLPTINPERALLARHLREWRKTRGFPLKQVAASFGVAEATWSRWEKQSRFPAPENLRLLAEFIGVPVCRFFYPDEEGCSRCSPQVATMKEP